MLTKIVITILVLVGAVVIAASRRPDTFSMAVNISMNATPEKIFPHINDLRAWNEWSPFEKGLEMKKTYEGPQAGKGAKLIFEGGRSGTGTTTIVDSNPPNRVQIKLIMTKPMACDNDVVLTVVPHGNTSTVAWKMSGHVNLVAKIMGMLFSEKMVRNQFETGLKNLKEIVEKE